MHELAITESILNIAVEQAEMHNASKVLEIRLKVGEFSGVLPQLIQDYFDIVSKDTIVEGAKLIIDRIPIGVKCNNCSHEATIDIMKIKCPVCGSTDVKIVSGKEFYVDSMEVE
jgi:hydrogenase nickel incorporation protein HypA/HybF